MAVPDDFEAVIKINESYSLEVAWDGVSSSGLYRWYKIQAKRKSTRYSPEIIYITPESIDDMITTLQYIKHLEGRNDETETEPTWEDAD